MMKRILLASMLFSASVAQSAWAASAATPAPKIEQTRILRYTFASMPTGMPLPAGARPMLEAAAPSTETAASATIAGRLCCRRSAPEATQLVIMSVKHHSTALKRMVVHRINTADGKFKLQFCFRDSLNKDTHYWSFKLSNQLDDMLRYAQIIQDNVSSHSLTLIDVLPKVQEDLTKKFSLSDFVTDESERADKKEVFMLIQLILCHLSSVASEKGFLTNVMDKLMLMTLVSLLNPA
jgi:hypothetical protein